MKAFGSERTYPLRMSLVAVAAVVAMCLLILVVRVEPSHAAFPGQNGKIAFDSSPVTATNPTGDTEIFTINPELYGLGPTQLTDNTARDGDPAWSPDGTKIAFSSNRDTRPANTEIYTMNPDGSNQTRLTYNLESDSEPAWSPDGTKITVRRFHDVWTMNADGSNQTNISNNPDWDSHPAWSPDGTKIAFTTTRDGSPEIYTMNADGSNQTNISSHAESDFGPAWSPDGTKIAFTTFRDGIHSEIYTMNPDGSDQTNISNTGAASEFSPAWSPDGTKIAFRCPIPLQDYEIYTMNADGSNKTNITNNPAGDGNNPDWQPITNTVNTAPTITSLRPPPGSSTIDRTPTVAATITDQQTDLAKSNITLVLDDETIPRTSFSYRWTTDRMTYTPADDLSLGNHALKVIARDSSGLSTTKRWSFEIVQP
jgi:dipeptidyl aminopeptidase/acylaminoacyl peptidase